MELCLCNRLYNVNVSATISEHAFSGSLCRIREFETVDGKRYCLTVFNLGNYKHLHFPHYEYRCLVQKLNVLLTTQAILHASCYTDEEKLNGHAMTIQQLPHNGDFKIKFGIHRLQIGIVSAIGLVNFSPFDASASDTVSSVENHKTCDSQLDICVCKTCPVFLRLCDFEAAVLKRYPHRTSMNIIMFEEN